MAEKQSINFDDGLKDYEINGDPNRVIRINPTDFQIFTRMDNAIGKLKEEMGNVQNIKDTGSQEEAMAALRESNDVMRKAFDEIFYDGAAQIVFGDQNPLSVSHGKSIFENFLYAFKDLIEPEFKKEKEASDARISKYKDAYDKPLKS